MSAGHGGRRVMPMSGVQEHEPNTPAVRPHPRRARRYPSHRAATRTARRPGLARVRRLIVRALEVAGLVRSDLYRCCCACPSKGCRQPIRGC